MIERGMLAQITAPHFVAGIVLSADIVTAAAPIVRYMVGWDRGRVRSYVARKGWAIRVVNDQSRPEGRP